jgi:hypothetical protein
MMKERPPPASPRSRLCCNESRVCPEYGDVVDPSSIDMTLGGGDDDEGWGYGWRKRFFCNEGH